MPLLPLLALLAAAPPTLRVDVFHTGDSRSELFAVDRVVVEPLPWPGNLARSVDTTNLGKYLFEVRSLSSNRLLYSRGYASVFGEWQDTLEARTAHRTFQESFRFPHPGEKVQLIVKRRGPDQLFREVWTAAVDPQAPTVSAAPPPSPGPLIPLLENGPPEKKVDLLILGDGYTAAERSKFEKDARKLVELLFTYSPFKERKSDFNAWGLVPAAVQSGVSRPSGGEHRANPLGTAYDTFGAERYALTLDNRQWREAASYAPYEFVEILMNSKTYGGGGIHNLFSTVAADSVWAPYLFVHEFGHQFAGLADEYFTSASYYAPTAERPEPWERNVTALKNPAQLKWKHLVASSTPLPTPWEEEKFEKRAREFQEKRKQLRAQRRPESEIDALFFAEQKEETALLSSQKYAKVVGAFEGANYEAKGYYRPQVDCVMFTRDQVPFCRVCQEAISEVIDLYTR